ncbi:MAG: YicC/YloC family endoribonuclease [Janthinobacterium lividum]
MLLSMTGFGQAHRETDRYTATVELRSLNSKTLDLSLRLPRFLQAHELEIRQQITKALLRGKVNFNLDFTRPSVAATTTVLNKEALVAAFHELKVVAESLGLSAGEDTLLAALRLPGVIPTASEQAQAAQSEAGPADETTWAELQPLLTEALAAMQQFRYDEGQTLQREILGYIATIRQQLAAVELHDPQRIQHIRQRLNAHLGDLMQHEQFNATRFEQEILHYIEKLDIAEEKVRLAAHLDYFEQAIQQPDEAVGKKLGFLAQEIGREINTIGSKANDATVQHLVVGMKEELEKIKEQLNNIL